MTIAMVLVVVRILIMGCGHGSCLGNMVVFMDMFMGSGYGCDYWYGCGQGYVYGFLSWL